MSIIKLPRVDSRAHALLQALMSGPGTFYQVCERGALKIELETDEYAARRALDAIVTSGRASLSGIVYSISRSAREAFAPAAPKPVGQVATSHYRGPAQAMPVTIIRRSTCEVRA